MASVNHEPSEVARRCARYSGIVTDVLVDTSEGLGRPLDAVVSARHLDAIALAAPGLGLVVAGGLSRRQHRHIAISTAAQVEQRQHRCRRKAAG